MTGARPGLRITDELMTSPVTTATARYGDGRIAQGAWIVSWLPDRLLTQDQAVSAMILAEAVATGIAPGSAMWPHVKQWAAELHLTVEDAVARVKAGGRP